MGSRSSRTLACLALLYVAACGDDSASPVNVIPAPPVVVQPDEAEPDEAEPVVEDNTPFVAAQPPERAPESSLETQGPYRVDVGRDCDGFPYIPLQTDSSRCVGLVLHPESDAVKSTRGRFRPRGIVQDPNHDEVFWVVDAGARRPRAGRVWRLTQTEQGWTATSVLRRLDRPHGVAVGPDGLVYVGEVQRIVRFDPAADDPDTTVSEVVSNMPVQLRNRDRLRFHPLTAFVFTPEWDLIVNMGSGTDRCLESASADHCEDEDDDLASLWRYAYQGEGQWSNEHTVLARGLRNSVALAVSATGTILQAENGVDFSEANRPHEELNVIVEGQHYGWPYCYDRHERDPRWQHAEFQCGAGESAYSPPHLLLPPHAAPLGMLYCHGTRFPELDDRLLIAYHGYRTLGHRLVAFAVDDQGIPAPDAESIDLIAGWQATDHSPRGAPVGLTVARDGSIWLVEDKNGTVLRLSMDQWAASRAGDDGDGAAVESQAVDAGFVSLHQGVLVPRCAPCHDFLAQESTAAFAALQREGWLGTSETGTVLGSRIAPSAVRRMPPEGPLPAAEQTRLEDWLTHFEANRATGATRAE